MVANKAEHSRYSWWCQKGIAALACLGIATWLFMFASAADFSTSTTITKLEAINPKEIPSSPHYIGPLSAKANTERAPGIRLPTISLKNSQTLKLRATFNPTFQALPHEVAKRISWRVFRQEKGDLWLPVNNMKTTVGSPNFTNQFDHAGYYLIIVGLPQINLHDLDGKATPYFTKYLSSNASPKCLGFQVIVLSKRGQGSETRQTTDSTPVVPANAVHDSHAIPEPTTKQSQGKRDLRTKTDGDTHSNGASDASSTASKQSNVRKHGVAVAIPWRKGATPITLNEARILRTDGALPGIDLLYEPKQLASLTVREWEAICRRHHIPFVAVPTDAYTNEFPRWPLLLPDGTRQRLSFPDIRRKFGDKLLPLEKFSSDIQRQVEDRFNDPIAWAKCVRCRGFLLSDVLLVAVHEALSKERISVEKIGTIERIIVDITIDRKSGIPRLAVTSKQVIRKK